VGRAGGKAGTDSIILSVELLYRHPGIVVVRSQAVDLSLLRLSPLFFLGPLSLRFLVPFPAGRGLG
jgi:hypothetical protein